MEPLAEQFEIDDTHTFETTDGNTCHSISILDNTTYNQWILTIECTPSEDVASVFLIEDRHSYGNMQFAVFALYCYEAFGFPEIDADTFYEQYDLFSSEAIEKIETVSGWTIFVSANDDTISFSITDITDTDATEAYYDNASGREENTQSQIDNQEYNSSESSEQTSTTGQQSALDSANSYLSFMAFSYSGLIDQLEYEGFSTEDATYAADNCGADWNEQALLSGQNYLEYTAFSYSGLIDQLEYEGFTTEQATYGADNCGADWNEQAAKSAAEYLEIFDYSRDELIDQLEYEGFTAEQAAYGADANGF